MFESLFADPQAYAAAFGACALSGLVVPVPEDLPLLYTGATIAEGEMQIAPALVAVMLGVWLRDAIAYGIGRFVGETLLTRPGALRFFGEDRLDRARRIVDRLGGRGILLGRFLVGLRAPLFAVAGAMGMPPGRFFGWNGLGLLFAVPLVVFLGYAVGDPLIAAGTWFAERWRVIGPILLLATVLWLVWLRYGPRRRDAKTVE